MLLTTELKKSYTVESKVNKLDNALDFSGLCDGQTCLNDHGGWTQKRYFKFQRIDKECTSQNGNFVTTVKFKINSDDDWTHFPNKQGFLKFVPDLKKTPPMQVKSPCEEVRNSVKKYLQSVE